MSDTPIPDKAVTAAADAMRNLLRPFAHDCRDNLFGGQVGSLAPNTTEVVRAVLEAALPHLAESDRLRQEREALVRQHSHELGKLHDEIRHLTRLHDERDAIERQRPADRDTETAAPNLVMGKRPDGSPWVISAEFAGADVCVDAYGVLRLRGKAIAPAIAHRTATGLLAAIAWLENDGAAKAEAATSLGGEQA